MDADDVPRTDAQAPPAVSMINETAIRANRTIWVLLLVGNDLSDA
jgi:hypothetical protein